MSTERVAVMLGAPADVALALEATCIQFAIESALEKSHFLGQTMVESRNFTATRESLNYSVEGLLATFGRHRISEAQARELGRTDRHPAKQQAIANVIYGGQWGAENLGNTQPGDGWRFIGRGFPHLTGRSNYRGYSRDTYGDDRVVDYPHMLERLPDSALSAGWYWRERGIGRYARDDNAELVTKLVNGGYNGLAERIAATERAKAAFKDILHTQG